jgi:predicted phage baseplate assembly protein
MSLPAPKLDDRQFQDIVDEAKKRIPHYCKEWTDHNVSDPGVTLIELFAWMTDIILYRLNQVPDRHYIKFMEMLGIRLQEAQPAKTPLTFWLSAPQETKVVIPAGTEVANTPGENEDPIVFTTDESFHVVPPDLEAVITRVARRDGGKQYRTHNLRRLEAGFEGIEIFSEVPQVDDAIYFGFKNDISDHILGFEFDFDTAGGAGIDPSLPPYVAEASSADRSLRWEPCDVADDTTQGMNSPGRLRIYLPKLGRYRVNDQELFWVRLRVKDITAYDEREGMLPYQVSPRLRQVESGSWGGTVPATHSQLIENEILGRSDGSAAQQYQLQRAPLLPRKDGEHVIVQVEGEAPQVWTEVADFADSNARQRHYTLDSATGELRFGPAVRQPDGTIKLYGAVPPRGANILFSRYRIGGGQVGNVQEGVLNTMMVSIPYVASVTNRQAAWGGLDAEALESAMMRAPALLRSRDRAVTESDFEFLARQALPASIGRVKCLQPRPADEGRVTPGQIYVLVIPRVMRPSDYLAPNELELRDEDV